MKTSQRPITQERMTELVGQYIILRGSYCGGYANQLVRFNGFYKVPGYLIFQISTNTNSNTIAKMSTTLDKIAITEDQEEAKAQFTASRLEAGQHALIS